MRKLIVHEFMSLDGVMQAPGGKDEDTAGGFHNGGWTIPYWHDDIGAAFFQEMQGVDAFMRGRKTYVTHANAFEPMPAGDFFGDLMNAPKKYVVSKTLEKPIWRDTTIIRDNPIEYVRKLKEGRGKSIVLDGSSVLLHALLQADLVDDLHRTVYPVTLGSGKRVIPAGLDRTFSLVSSHPYPTGVLGLHYQLG